MFLSLLLLLATSAVASNIEPTCSNPRPRAILRDSHSPTCHGQTSDYVIRSSPGAGLGVFALRDLPIGHVIMRETPVLKIYPPEHIKGTGYPMRAVSQLLHADFAYLSLEEQEQIMDLAYSGTAVEKDGSDLLGLIFKTNAYKSGDEIGLFPKIARINHSCRPNTSYFWDKRRNQKVIYANRQIKKEEEISDSYISLLLPQEERQRYLDAYGFKCGCEACAAEKRSRHESDGRRMEIKRGFQELAPYLTLEDTVNQHDKRQAKRNARTSTQLVELVHKEGLADYYATAYRIAALSHARAEDWQNATIWANKGYEWRVMEDAESGYAMEMHELTTRFIENWKADLQRQSLFTGEV